MRKTGSKSDGDRLANRRADYRNCYRRILCRCGRWRPSRNDEVNIELDQLPGESRKPLGTAVGRAILDDEFLPFDVPEVTQPASQRIEVASVQLSGGRLQHADAIDFAPLLSTNRSGPTSRGPADQRDELPPPNPGGQDGR